MSDTAPQPGTPLHGPGGLLGTPGLGARRKGRKWGQRLKDAGYSARAGQTIRGNLARSSDGKFTAAGNASAAKPKRPAQFSKPPKPPKRSAAPKRAAAPKKGGGGKKGSAPKPKDPAVQARQQQRDQERASDRAQRQQDRQDRLKRQAQRDQERSADRATRQMDRALRDQERAAAAKKKLEAKLPKAGGGGGGGSKKPSDADKRQERTQRADATAQEVGLTPRDVDSLRQAAAGLGGATNPALAALGLIGADGLTTDQGRRALSALERGDVRGYHAALQDAKARQAREQAAQQRRTQAEGARTQRQQERQAAQQRKLNTLQRRARAGNKLTQAQRDQLTEAGLADESGGMWRVKSAASFAVFKDARGQQRWIARTTTAYRDRDGEIISAAALDADSQRMTQAKQFGPLRWWHVGSPDPFDLTQPWGPGLDIGDCDYSVVIGRTRIESGTFRDPIIARKMARVAARLEMSPGFFHPPDQPSADGVFSSIRTFERSPVPQRYGRASNLFTGFTVKEHRMDATEMERRFKAMITELQLTPETASDLAAGLVATEKAAAAQGIAFKSDETPAPPEEITIGGVTYTVKAAPPAMDVPAVETQADDPVEALAEEVGDDMAMEGDYLGDMTWEAFAAKLGELLAPVLKMQEMVKSVTDMGGELKSLYGGMATKEAGELAALKAAQQQLAQKIAQIEGDQPATVLPDDVAAALKSAGPSAPASPADPELDAAVSDPNRPFAAIAARTMPALYKNTPGGEFAGWTPPAAP